MRVCLAPGAHVALSFHFHLCLVSWEMATFPPAQPSHSVLPPPGPDLGFPLLETEPLQMTRSSSAEVLRPRMKTEALPLASEEEEDQFSGQHHLAQSTQARLLALVSVSCNRFCGVEEKSCPQFDQPEKIPVSILLCWLIPYAGSGRVWLAQLQVGSWPVACSVLSRGAFITIIIDIVVWLCWGSNPGPRLDRTLHLCLFSPFWFL